MISKQHGAVIFHILEGTNLDVELEEIQDESFTKVQSKLLKEKELTEKRKLVVELGILTYAPALSNKPQNIDEDYYVAINEQEITEYLSLQEWDKSEYYEQLCSVIQAITSITKKNQRSYIQKEDE